MQNNDEQINVNDPDYDDPILAEIRQIRNDFSDRFNGDMDAMYRYFVQERSRNPIRRMLDDLPHDVQPSRSGSGTGAPDGSPHA